MNEHVTNRGARMNKDPEPLLEVNNVGKRFGSFQALKGVSTKVFPADVVSIIGPSGSGKSTLVRCMNSLETIDSGSIYFDGELLGYTWRRGKLVPMTEREAAHQRRDIGMVFQSFNLFSHMSVLENIVRPLVLVHDVERDAAVERARHLLDRVGLRSKEENYPNTLSGGEQQRVAIARALACDPKIMLFDEPTSALDPELVGEVLQVLRELAETDRTMVVVTHDLSFAEQVSDWCLFMESGLVVEQGPAQELFRNPQTARLERYLSLEGAAE